MTNASLLECIDHVNSVTDHAEIKIIQSMTQAYLKSAMILEHYKGEDLSAFEIFQEGVIGDSIADTKRDLAGQNIFMKIIKFIPRLLMNLVRNIKRLLPSNQIRSLQKELDELHRLSDDQKAELDQLRQSQAVQGQRFNDRLNAVENKPGQAPPEPFDPTDLKERLNKHEEKLDRLDMRTRQMGLQISFTNEIVHFNFDFEKAVEYLNQMQEYIKDLSRFAIDPKSYRRSDFQSLYRLFEDNDIQTLVMRLGYKSVKASFFDAKQFINEFDICSKDTIKHAQQTADEFEDVKNMEMADADTIRDCSEIIDVLQKMIQFLTEIHAAGAREIRRVHTGIRILKEVRPLPTPTLGNYS